MVPDRKHHCRNSEVIQGAPIVFLVDVDNTLLDNDGVQQDLKDHLERAYGRDARDRYWSILEDRPAQKVSATPIRSLRRCCNVPELPAFKSR